MRKKTQCSQVKNNSLKARGNGMNSQSPDSDCDPDSHYDVLVELLIRPTKSPRQHFWDPASRVVLKTALKKYAAQNVHNIESFYAFLKKASTQEFEAFFEGTDAAPYTSSHSCLSLAIRTLLLSYVADFLQAYSQLLLTLAEVSEALALGSESPLAPSDLTSLTPQEE